MKFLTIASLAASAAAAPALQIRQTNSTIADNTPFALLAIRSGSELQYASFSATQGSLVLNLGTQDAVCATDATSATFYLSNGALYLYTPANITQELYTDRSGMGQGVLQYSTTPGGYLPGRNSETSGWVLDNVNDITFDKDSLIACPASVNSTSGPYSVWVNTGVTSPGGNVNCLGIAARAVPVSAPNACTYSYRPLTSS